ncbi:hypothetical protein C2S52_010353 [Perilla frutescens var. hirtella]|nr:hypothetical protein C2S52_010353 [Perilla frutescens var. hirtella]
MASPALLAPLLSQMRGLLEAVSPSVVAIKTNFSPAENGEFQPCTRVGTGIFVDRDLIVTSAHAIGLVSTVRSCFIGRTIALTAGNKVLKTRPLAVNFGGDVAVLVAEGDLPLPPACAVARSVPSKELPLMVMTMQENCSGIGMVQMKFRSTEDNTERSAWAYPIGDNFGWVRYGGEAVDDIKIIPGSPWFSLGRDVGGIASWEAGDEPAGSVGGFVVPPSRITALLDYAKGKGTHDPIVIDPWITATTIADDCPAAQDSFQNVASSTIVTLYV